MMSLFTPLLILASLWRYVLPHHLILLYSDNVIPLLLVGISLISFLESWGKISQLRWSSILPKGWGSIRNRSWGIWYRSRYKSPNCLLQSSAWISASGPWMEWFLFLGMTVYASILEKQKRTWHHAGPYGAAGHNFLCPSFFWLQETAFIQPPWSSLRSNGQIQAVVN